MQPSYISISSLFGVQTRYTVPLFQRPYVWNRTDQWEPLWEDLQPLIERVLTTSPGTPIAGHFLGTVVLQHAHTTVVNTPRREVIDGQQRLTTLQLLLKASEHALALLGQETTKAEDAPVIITASEQLSLLTKNTSTYNKEEIYKVWPTNEDRDPFTAVMSSSFRLGTSGQQSRMAEAYDFFREVIVKWLLGPNVPQRAQALASALKNHLRLIVLDLDETDEPQAIFETLNAHGTPLLPADLMKNWILWEATKQKLPVQPLYEDYWRPFDRDASYWREKIGVGHAARPRIDMFFQNWLARHTRKFVSPKHIYDNFLRYVAVGASRSSGLNPDIHIVLADIRDDAIRFRQIQRPDGSGRFADFLRRLDRLDVLVFYPFLLAIMGRNGSDAYDQDQVGAALESYLIRRMVCNLQTRGYGALALELLDVLAAVPADQPAAPAIIDSLDQPPQSAMHWPDDDLFKREWTTRRFYGSLRKDRVLMLLQAIEEEKQRQTTKSEPIIKFDFSKLTIEHILPQSWHTHWVLPEGALASDRDYAVHGVGNLTLVSDKLNPSLSNAPWMPTEQSKYSKKAALAQHSKLELNARLVHDHPERWDEAAISKRAEQLNSVARAVWPSAQTLRARLQSKQSN